MAFRVSIPPSTNRLFRLSLVLIALLDCICAFPNQSLVAIVEDDSSFTLDNGRVRARASKRSGDLMSLKYRGVEVLNAQADRPAGYWSHNVERGRRSARITIDPKANSGQRGEISLKGEYAGVLLGTGPGGGAAVDIEIRYALERGASGLYTYSVFEHPTNYPATALGEARFCAKLNDDLFDWMTVDAHRNLRMLTAYDWNHGTVMNMKEARRLNTGIYQGCIEHKYDYAANQFEVRAWGWISTSKRVGVWFINPSVEYLSGGPTKFELCAHRDATFGTNLNAPAPPTLLNYWRSSHYGGSSCAISSGEHWTKVIGPFLIYCNAEADSDELWKDALAEASRQSGKWPYDWVRGVDYPAKPQRAALTGRLVLHDPELPHEIKFTRLLVGLSAPGPDFIAREGSSEGRRVDWQRDAKGYQFWVRGQAGGDFTIPQVRPGHYSLHAVADGVLGEFTLTNITLAAGQTLDLGSMRWEPVRYGRQLWEIGIPNRSGCEFFKGDDYFHWGWYLQYAKLFPDDVTFVLGKSDFRKHWFFEQVPHNEDAANVDARRPGRSTTWTVLFNLPEVHPGRAMLRLALCGIGTRTLTASVNGTLIGTLSGLSNNSTISRDGICGTWSEHDLSFEASALKAGENSLKLTIPGGNLTSGIIYDYLRLELAD